MQFRRIASEFQPLAINWPRIAPNRNQTGAHPNWGGAMLAQSFAILGIVVELQIPGNPTAGADGLQSAIEIGPLLQPIPDCGTVDPKATTPN